MEFGGRLGEVGMGRGGRTSWTFAKVREVRCNEWEGI